VTGTFRNLDAWKKSIKLAKKTYELTEKFPKNEIFGLTSQIRRAAVSISNNISEGSGYRSRKKKLSYYEIAFGSCNEVENLSVIAMDLGYINDDEQEDLMNFIGSARKPLSGLIKYIENKINDEKSKKFS
jgi:four helix bundle protein